MMPIFAVITWLIPVAILFLVIYAAVRLATRDLRREPRAIGSTPIGTPGDPTRPHPADRDDRLQ